MARVEELLAERMSLRKSRDFGGADVLRDELRAIGVTVLDREMRWFVGARQGYRGDDGGRGPAAAERSAAAVAESRARGNGRAPFDPAQFGHNGHDYTQSIPNGDYGTELDEATLATVHSLLARQHVFRPPPPSPPFGCARARLLRLLWGWGRVGGGSGRLDTMGRGRTTAPHCLGCSSEPPRVERCHCL